MVEVIRMNDTNKVEPSEAFPYEPPSEELKARHANVFALSKPSPRIDS